MRIIRVPIPGFCLHERDKWEPYVTERGIDISIGKCYTYYSQADDCYVIMQEREDDVEESEQTADMAYNG